eukprot:NODE_1774_length_1412_cov_20.475422_g1603_i0.p1 GENE.NODE_1774_length_1412_cov_20.475422_g1603_i0~~NODE_1774_length_1412_cov_20.475422_g1603_i0.p1  ORF type:complete len:325 (+),score=69.82 NODE_1774_length_1412_cov_20.475422_g1603_i0:112-975(+)
MGDGTLHFTDAELTGNRINRVPLTLKGKSAGELTVMLEGMMPLDPSIPRPPMISVLVGAARNLRKADMVGQNDAYVLLEVENSQTWQTTLKSSKTPVWDENHVFNLPAGARTMQVQVWDKDLIGKDLIGEGTLPLDCINLNRETSHWVPLAYKGKAAGEVMLGVQAEYPAVCLAPQETFVARAVAAPAPAPVEDEAARSKRIQIEELRRDISLSDRENRMKEERISTEMAALRRQVEYERGELRVALEQMQAEMARRERIGQHPQTRTYRRGGYGYDAGFGTRTARY